MQRRAYTNVFYFTFITISQLIKTQTVFLWINQINQYLLYLSEFRSI